MEPEGEMVLKAALNSADPLAHGRVYGWVADGNGHTRKTKDGQHTSPSLTMFEIDLSIWQLGILLYG